jgi:type II secretory pathway pseudopilin PulG
LLVVIGILVLLFAIAVPTLIISYRKARATKTAADLQAIATGLEAYRTDFGDYPRVEAGGTGFAVLTKALISPGPTAGPLPGLGTAPYPAGTDTSTGTPGNAGYVEYVAVGAPDPAGGFSAPGAPPGTDWAAFYVSDGKDGPGFRARPGGKAYGPYLDPARFKLRGLAILDGWDNPILYFPAGAAKVAQDTSGGKTWPLLIGGAASVYNIADNIPFFLRPGETVAGNKNEALARMDAAMVQGSQDFNGIIKAGEAPATTGPFLLWSGGPDGRFGVTFKGAAAGTAPTQAEMKKYDDITNFATP